MSKGAIAPSDPGSVARLPTEADTDLESRLDRAAWLSLVGPHAGFALGRHGARRYRPEYAPFAAVAEPRDPGCWVDLAALYQVDETAVLSGPTGFGPPASMNGWAVDHRIAGVQLVATPEFVSAPEPSADPIGDDEAVEARDLVARTEPGPFRPQTHHLGRYLGLRRNGQLVALAGERLHPAGWTEISAVCTDPDHRRRGLATRLVRSIAHGIRARDETPFLHTGAANSPAIRLYLDLGFRLRREVDFLALRRTR